MVKRPNCNDKDVGSNPTATRNEKRTLGESPTEGSPMVQTEYQWKTSDGKAENVKLNKINGVVVRNVYYDVM